MDKRIDELLAHISKCVGNLYIIGGQGHLATVSYLNARKRAQPTYFTGGKYEYLLRKIMSGKQYYAWDCSGLFWDAANKTNLFGKQMDTTADTLFRKYCRKINKSELRPGDIVFRSSSTGKKVHMAIVGKNVVYEAMGAFYGVVAQPSVDERRALNGNTQKLTKQLPWDTYCRLNIFADGN